jgi:hypothetical protein
MISRHTESRRPDRRARPSPAALAGLLAVGWCMASASCDRPAIDAVTKPSGPELPWTRDPRAIGAVGDRTLVIVGEPTRGPEGTDEPERIALALRDPAGRESPFDPGTAVLAAAVWRGAIVVLAPDERLLRVAESGHPTLLAREVVGELAVARDGQALAYARSPGNEGTLCVLREGGETIVARGLSSAGSLRFTEDGEQLCFVGARNGGVLGVHITSTRSDERPRCLTNCTLRAGSAWEDPFIDLPDEREGRSSLECDPREVRWRTRDGQRMSIALGRSP